jgi:hypothetical protein
MHSTLQLEIASRQLAQRLRTENDPSLLDQALEKGNESAKICLASNPHLSKEQWERLSKDDSVDVRREVAKSGNIPAEFLQNLCNDKEEEVKLGAFNNPLTDFAVYKDAVMNGKFSTYSKQLFGWELRVVEDVEVFEHLWTTVKNTHTDLVHILNRAHYQNYPTIDPECAHVIHDHIRKEKTTATLREAYAGSVIALPEILDQLKTDSSRPVINAVAKNGNAWVSTHEHLASSHKTPAIRLSIALVTKDNELLNKIYHGTKSKEIRERVEKNPIFVNLKA